MPNSGNADPVRKFGASEPPAPDRSYSVLSISQFPRLDKQKFMEENPNSTVP